MSRGASYGQRSCCCAVVGQHISYIVAPVAAVDRAALVEPGKEPNWSYCQASCARVGCHAC